MRLKHLRQVRRSPAGAGEADWFLASYVSWRAACVAVRSAYEGWRSCEPALRSLAFDSYRVALDREEDAARIHSERVEQAGPVSG
jgi:hypothetical protein